MANDLNQCNFIGRLGQDPEIRYMPSGKAVANFSIAVGSSWRDKDSGEKKEKTEWVRVSAFGKLAEIIDTYLKKGAQVYLSGRMQTRKWQDKDGNDRWTTEIVADQLQMLGGRGESQQSSQPSAPDAPAAKQDDFEDDIPF